MGRGEELGSGVLNVSKYLPFYAKGAKPRFVEGDPFVTIIPLPLDGPAEGAAGGEISSVKSREKSREKSKEKNSDRVLALIRDNQVVTVEEVVAAVELSRAGVEKIVRNLKRAGRLRRIGPDKGGHWEVISPTEGAHG